MSSFGLSKYVTKIEELRRAMLTLSHSGDDLAKSLAGALTITRTPKEQFTDKVRVIVDRDRIGRQLLSVVCVISFYLSVTVCE